MKLKGKFNADLTAFAVKRNQTHDGREGFVTIEIGIEQEEASSKIGEDFEALAFSTMRVIEAEGDDDTDQVGFLVDNVKPGKRCVFERHEIKIAGHKLNEQPEMLSIKPVDGSRKVVAVVRIPVDVTKAELISQLTQKIGETLKVEFEPRQGELELTPRKSKAHEAEASSTVQ